MGKAAAAIWQEIQEHLRAFIVRRVANRSEAEDILQDVFVRMHQRIDTLKDPRRVLPWLYQITRHAIIDHYRTPRRRRELPVGLVSDMERVGITSTVRPAALDRDSAELRAELSGCLRSMIDRLPKEYREALTLVELEGLTQRAAAKRVELSFSGMKSRLQRGRKQLKQMLDECCLIQLDRRRGVMEYEVRDGASESCKPSPKVSR